MNYNRLFFIHALIVLFVVATDQVSKFYALAHCVTEQKINSFFSCYLTFNRGISWGMLHDANSFVFVLITILIACITLFIAYLTLARLRDGLWSIGYVGVVAGSVSNLIDRVVYGAVVDFMAFSLAGWNFPVFNVADMCIVGGIALILYESLFTTAKN